MNSSKYFRRTQRQFGFDQRFSNCVNTSFVIWLIFSWWQKKNSSFYKNDIIVIKLKMAATEIVAIIRELLLSSVWIFLVSYLKDRPLRW